MSEFYQIRTEEGQCVIDIALNYYGHVDGADFVLEDNPGIVSEITDELAAGTVINIRENPVLEDMKRLDFMRNGKPKQVINLNLTDGIANASCVKLDAAISQDQYEDCLVPSRPADQTVNGVNNADAAKKEAIINALSNYFEFTITIKAGSEIEPQFRVPAYGVIKSVTATNLDSYTLKRLRGVTITDIALPNEVDTGDIIIARSAVQTNPALDSTIVIKGYYDTRLITHTFPDEQGDDRYQYWMNYIDQTISVLDTDSDLIIATIVLPAGKNFSAVTKRLNKAYVFGNSYHVVIDADDASGTFNTIISQAANAYSSITAASYDFELDRFALGNATNLSIADGATLALIQTIPGVSVISVALRCGLQYIYPTKQFALCDFAVTTMLDARNYNLNGVLNSNLVVGMARYNPKNGFIYLCGSGSVYVLTLDGKLHINIVNANAFRSSIAFVPELNKAFVGNIFGNSIAVIETANNTSLGSAVKDPTKIGANELGTRGIIYSRHSGKIYAQASNNTGALTGINKIHVFDPTQPVANMYVKDITVGNMMSSNTMQYQQHQGCSNYLDI